MKKKLIIAAIAILVVLAIATPVCVFRDRIPRKINSAERFEEVFGIEIAPEYVVEEYSFYTIDNYVNRPQTSLCFKLDMTCEEFEEILDDAELYYKTSPFNEFWGSGYLYALLPEDKKLDLENLELYGHYYLVDRYIMIPGLCDTSVSQNVSWYCSIENDKEYIYIYTYKYRNYAPAMAAK